MADQLTQQPSGEEIRHTTPEEDEMAPSNVTDDAGHAADEDSPPDHLWSHEDFMPSDCEPSPEVLNIIDRLVRLQKMQKQFEAERDMLKERMRAMTARASANSRCNS